MQKGAAIKYCDKSLLTDAFQYNGSFDNIDVPEWINAAFRDRHLQMWDGQLFIVPKPDMPQSNMCSYDGEWVIRYGISGKKVNNGDYIIRFDFWNGGIMSSIDKETFERVFIPVGK